MTDEEIREFAVHWSTRSNGKIASLAGAYLRAIKRAEDAEDRVRVLEIQIAAQSVVTTPFGELRFEKRKP